MMKSLFFLMLISSSSLVFAGRANDMFRSSLYLSNSGAYSDAHAMIIETCIREEPRLIKQRNVFGDQNTILHIVAARCHVGLVRFILSYPETVINVEALAHRTPLSLAESARRRAEDLGDQQKEQACSQVINILNTDPRSHLKSRRFSRMLEVFRSVRSYVGIR